MSAPSLHRMLRLLALAAAARGSWVEDEAGPRSSVLSLHSVLGSWGDLLSGPSMGGSGLGLGSIGIHGDTRHATKSTQHPRRY